MSEINQLEVLRSAFDPSVDWTEYNMSADYLIDSTPSEQQKLDVRINSMQDKLDSEIMGVTYSAPASLATLSLTALNLVEGESRISTFFAGLSTVGFIGLSVYCHLHARSTSQTLSSLEAISAQSKLDASRG